MNKYITNDITLNAADVRQEYKQGREFLVTPVVAAVESVMNGSQGANLVLRQELSKSAQSLNGRPITIDHPAKGANSPDINNIGTVFNATMDGAALKAEAWFDVELLRKAGATGLRIMQAVKNKEMLEVSLGWLQDVISQAGTQFGETYQMIATNIQHDHLAVLLDTQGACSVADGCGLVRNEEKEEMEEDKNAASLLEKIAAALGISQDEPTEVNNMAENTEVQEPEVTQDNTAILDAIAGLKEAMQLSIKEVNERVDGIVANQAAQEKAPFVARLVANERCPLGEDALTAMSVCDLKKLESSYKPADYSANAGSVWNAATFDEDEFRLVEVE